MKKNYGGKTLWFRAAFMLAISLVLVCFLAAPALAGNDPVTYVDENGKTHSTTDYRVLNENIVGRSTDFLLPIQGLFR